MPKINYRDRLEDGELDLSMSELEDVPVKEIMAIKKATSLDLSNNHLTSLGKNFVQVTHIVKLDLSKNSLTELPEDFGSMVQLKHLDLYSNEIARLPLSFGELRNLKWLDLKNNPLVPALADIAGPCLDSSQCQQCARKVVQFLKDLGQQVEVERLKRQQQMAKEAKTTTPKEKQEKKKKKSKNAKTEQKVHNGPRHSEENGTTESLKTAKPPAESSPTPSKRTKTISRRSTTVFSCISWLMYATMICMLIMAIAGVALYYVDEVKFRMVQTKLETACNATIAILPPVIVNGGRSAMVYIQPISKLLREKLCSFSCSVTEKAKSVYITITTDVQVQKLTEHAKDLWRSVYAAVNETCTTLSREWPVYYDTVKKKLFPN